MIQCHGSASRRAVLCRAAHPSHPNSHLLTGLGFCPQAPGRLQIPAHFFRSLGLSPWLRKANAWRGGRSGRGKSGRERFCPAFAGGGGGSCLLCTLGLIAHNTQPYWLKALFVHTRAHSSLRHPPHLPHIDKKGSSQHPLIGTSSKDNPPGLIQIIHRGIHPRWE